MAAEPPKRGASRLLLRAPIWIYRAGLGGLMPERLVLLTHIGRTSGTARQVVLEVVGTHPGTGRYLVASGFGARSQWLRNITAEPRVRFQVGARRFEGLARPLPERESGEMLARYAGRHPRLARRLMGVCGHTVPAGAGERADAYRSIGADARGGVPIVELVPGAPGPG